MVSIYQLFAAVLFVATLPIAAAADRVVASVPGGAVLTADDLTAEAMRLPPPAQAQVFSRPADVARFAQNVIVRRELARRAEAERLQDDPKVAAALRSARERVLAEAELEYASGPPADRATLEQLARNQYDAAPQKFETPEQVRVRHILVSAKACEAETRARELLAKARQPGADFAALAKENSDDPGSAARGGDLGFFERGRMTPAFEAAAFSLKQPGDLSDVVKTEFGYHVIRLEEHKPAQRRSYEEVRGELLKTAEEGETRARRQRVVGEITAGIKFDSEAVDALVASQAKAARPN